jgi:hypothetical protein
MKKCFPSSRLWHSDHDLLRYAITSRNSHVPDIFSANGHITFIDLPSFQLPAHDDDAQYGFQKTWNAPFTLLHAKFECHCCKLEKAFMRVGAYTSGLSQPRIKACTYQLTSSWRVMNKRDALIPEPFCRFLRANDFDLKWTQGQYTLYIQQVGNHSSSEHMSSGNRETVCSKFDASRLTMTDHANTDTLQSWALG